MLRSATLPTLLVAAIATGCGSHHGSTFTTLPSTTAPASSTPASSQPAVPAPPAPPTPASVPSAHYDATLGAITASEFGGGWGIQPVYDPSLPPPTPPPPALWFTATLVNTGNVPLDPSDPRLAIELRWADAANPSVTFTKVVKLSQPIPVGATIDQTIDIGPIAHVVSPVDVTCALAAVDASGTVYAYFTPPPPPVVVTPTVFYPL